MMKVLSFLFAAVACSIPAFAQMEPGAGPGAGSDFDAMEKLFGANPAFSATMSRSLGPTSAKIKLIFDHGNSSGEMNMADVQDPNLPPQAVDQMKSIGLDDVVTIIPADKLNLYVVYPHIRSYVALPIPDSGATNNAFSMQTTKLGQETVDGHPCVKNDVLMTNSLVSTDFTVWNATDLNNFPIKIATSEQGMPETITFQDISFDKPPADAFRPPAHFTRYGNIQDLMQAAEMNHPSGMPGMPSPSVSPGP
ncbi:MAG TPA: hypothetical protein VME24_09840 [Alphaproteobacteria bacterium]|nr:hypothetical protein [Alphaproteobacteria bacterium]